MGLLQNQEMAHTPNSITTASYCPHSHGQDEYEKRPLLVIAHVRQAEDHRACHELRNHAGIWRA